MTSETDAACYAALKIIRRQIHALRDSSQEDIDNLAFASQIVFDEEKTPEPILSAEQAALDFMHARLAFHQEQLEIMKDVENSIFDSLGK